MKIAFVSNSHGAGPLLETALLMLVERHDVDRIVPVGSAVRDVESVIVGRQRRFPDTVEWTAPGYPDYVLAAVLEGVVDTPAAEVERTQLLSAVVRPMNGREAIEIEGRALSVTQPGETEADTPIVVSDYPGRHGVEWRGGRIHICPGQLKELVWDEEPASCALVAMAEGQLYVGFLDLYGDLLEEAIAIDPR